jgi:YfiH family protein
VSGPGLIFPDWPAPPGVRAVSTTRTGGFSDRAYRSLNLGAHVGDEPGAVARNRQRLLEACGLDSEPCWLRQVHGIGVAELGGSMPPEPVADASVARSVGPVCVVLTADCLPVLLADRRGTTVAAAHAGWRGLAGGVLRATVRSMGVPPADLLAWLGPAIGQEAFEVGPEVRERFAQADAGATSGFRRGAGDRWHADLAGLARRALAACGVESVYGGDQCTYSDPGRFFSHRRDGPCGRMASMIWLADPGHR